MGFLFEIIFNIAVWIVLLPFCWIVSTPVIFIAAFFGRVPYWQAVKRQYCAVTRFWLELLGHIF